MFLFRRAGVIVLACMAGGFIPALLATLFQPGRGLEYFWLQFRVSLTYSWSIGLLTFAAMELVCGYLARLPRPFEIGGQVLVFLVTATVGTMLANLLFLAFGWISSAHYWANFRFGIRISIAITCVIGAAVTGYSIMASRLSAATLDLRTRQLAEERARKITTAARLSSLESRVHPHFLFNTLNSISALIREDPTRAERMVERLAALLRYSLDLNSRGTVPLHQELHIVEDYLEIEKSRLGDRLQYFIDIPTSASSVEVPPLSVQTLVENSVKYAVSPNRQGGRIELVARLDASQLVLEVIDDGPGFDASALKPNHGLENLQERLAALFDGAGRLAIEQREGRTVVSILVPRGTPPA
jgi:signal transduction histidine kinase